YAEVFWRSLGVSESTVSGSSLIYLASAPPWSRPATSRARGGDLKPATAGNNAGRRRAARRAGLDRKQVCPYNDRKEPVGFLPEADPHPRSVPRTTRGTDVFLRTYNSIRRLCPTRGPGDSMLKIANLPDRELLSRRTPDARAQAWLTRLLRDGAKTSN